MKARKTTPAPKVGSRAVVLPYATPPGETLRETLKAKGISQTLLAETMGRPIKTINERMTAADFKKQFGSSVGNQIVNESAMKPQIRLPKNTGPNKTEAEWMRICQSKNIDSVVLYEPWSLKLPSGSKYTPDVVVIDGANQDGRAMITCYEVKGAHIHQSGGRSILAFKEARAAYPWMRFVFAQKRKDGWATSE